MPPPSGSCSSSSSSPRPSSSDASSGIPRRHEREGELMRDAPTSGPADRPVAKPEPALAAPALDVTGGTLQAGAGAVAAAAPPKSLASPEVRPVGDRTHGLRRRIAFALMVGYALLMFVPFAWTIVTSF